MYAYARRVFALYYVPICLLIVLSSCAHRSCLVRRKVYIKKASLASEKPSPEACQQVDPTLSVWVHGTMFGLDALFKKAFDAKPGIKHLHEMPHHHFLTLRLKALADQCSDFFPYESVYCFCWSGRLNNVEREKTAYCLHKVLVALLDEYQTQHGFIPRIRLVCHSHGANVALNLARINAHAARKITVDTLILFACPVQCETKELVHDPMFKRIYSLYSPLDWVQVVAPQWACCVYNEKGSVIASKQQWLPLSGRRFSASPTLRQAWVKMNGLALSHSDFSSKKFLRLLPQFLEEMDKAYDEHPELFTCSKELLLHIKRP
jgi:hypothetical protein